MLHSTITSKGQTTIPALLRDLWGLKPGDRLIYDIHGSEVTLRLQPGIASLKGVLASRRGKDKSLTEIRTELASKSRGPQHD